MYLNYIGRCKVCGEGDVIIIKEKKSNTLILICDDCESQWENPENFFAGKYITNEYNSFDENISDEEIELYGWDKYLKK